MYIFLLIIFCTVHNKRHNTQNINYLLLKNGNQHLKMIANCYSQKIIHTIICYSKIITNCYSKLAIICYLMIISCYSKMEKLIKLPSKRNFYFSYSLFWLIKFRSQQRKFKPKGSHFRVPFRP